MNEKARKYVDLFRNVKIASAGTVDGEGHPRSRIINVMIAADEGMYIVGCQMPEDNMAIKDYVEQLLG